MTKILAVYESPTLQKVFEVAFARYDVSILYTTSFHEARKELAVEKVSLILADTQISDPRQIADLSAFLKQHEGIPQILLSGSFANGPSAIQTEKSYWLKRPFDVPTLITVTEQALGRKLNPLPGPVTPGFVPGINATAAEGGVPVANGSPAKAGVLGGSASATSDVRPFLDQHLASLVEKAVYHYCEQHFAGLAREAITAEIRRLLDDKTRHLVDI